MHTHTPGMPLVWITTRQCKVQYGTCKLGDDETGIVLMTVEEMEGQS